MLQRSAVDIRQPHDLDLRMAGNTSKVAPAHHTPYADMRSAEPTV